MTCRKVRRGRSASAISFVESFNSPSCIHYSLLTREERVAHVADLDLDLGQRGLGLEGVAADAGHGALNIRGMDIGLHDALPRGLPGSAWRIQAVAHI